MRERGGEEREVSWEAGGGEVREETGRGSEREWDGERERIRRRRRVSINGGKRRKLQTTIIYPSQNGGVFFLPTRVLPAQTDKSYFKRHRYARHV